jgi:Holliday junction resolvasome RuvABC endonuclease subunit
MIPRSVILGLDASPKRIGWAVIDYDSAVPLKWGVEHIDQIRTLTKDADDLRARRLAFREISRIANGRGDVCAVIVEDAYVGASKLGSIVHALSVGNVEAFAAAAWPFVLVSRVKAATWRKQIGVKQRGKEATIEWARELTGETLTDDVADALGIATAGHKLVWKGAVK